jgi:hypothetical protein
MVTNMCAILYDKQTLRLNNQKDGWFGCDLVAGVF